MTGIIISIVVVCLILVAFSRPKRRDGLVPEGGSRVKNALALIMVKSGPKNLDDWRSAKNADRRVPVPEGVEEAMYNDSFVFQGADAEGNIILTRLGFRNGGREAEVWFWGAWNGQRFANDERLITRDADPDPSAIAAGGVEYTRIGDGEWRITFGGALDGRPGRADLVWKADAAMYFSPQHMDPAGTARAMAEMPWDREYFEKLRSENQVRIEQGGRLTGTVEIDGSAFNVDMRGVRDHSWGKRDWAYINRYMWTMLVLEEPAEISGIRAKYLAVTPADYGGTFSRIVSGWVAGDDEVRPVSFATDQFHLGGDGVIPGEFEIRFRSPGQDIVAVSVDRRPPEMPWIVNNGDFEVNEAWCSVNLGGVRGYGIAEFGYAADRGYGRPFEKDGAD